VLPFAMLLEKAVRLSRYLVSKMTLCPQCFIDGLKANRAPVSHRIRFRRKQSHEMRLMWARQQDLVCAHITKSVIPECYYRNPGDEELDPRLKDSGRRSGEPHLLLLSTNQFSKEEEENKHFCADRSLSQRGYPAVCRRCSGRLDLSSAWPKEMRFRLLAVPSRFLLGNTLNDSCHGHPEGFPLALFSSIEHPRFAMLHLWEKAALLVAALGRNDLLCVSCACVLRRKRLACSLRFSDVLE